MKFYINNKSWNTFIKRKRTSQHSIVVNETSRRRVVSINTLDIFFVDMELKSKVILWKTFDISYNVNAKLVCTWFLTYSLPTHFSMAFLNTYPFLCLIYPLIIELMICNSYAGRIFQRMFYTLWYFISTGCWSAL